MLQEEFQEIQTINNENGLCLGIKVSSENLVAQIFTNNVFAIYKDNELVKQFVTEKEIQSCTWAHEDSLHKQYLYFFGQQLSAFDVEKQKIAWSVNTETNYCGDSNIWNEICTAHDKTIVFWDIRSKAAFNCVLAHSMRITSLYYDETGRLITTTGQDNCVRVFDSFQMEALSTICCSKKTHSTSSQFLRNNRYLLITALQQPIYLWDWIQSQQIAQYKINDNNRFYNEPIILYDNEGIPNKILCANDINQIYQNDLMNPANEPKIKDILLFENPPFRIEKHKRCESEIYLYSANHIYKYQL